MMGLRMSAVVGLMAAALPLGALDAPDVKSGLEVGQKVIAFEPTHLSGPLKGKRAGFF